MITRSPVKGFEGSLITAAYLLNPSPALTEILFQMKSGMPDPGMNALRPGFPTNLASRSSSAFLSSPPDGPPVTRSQTHPICVAGAVTAVLRTTQATTSHHASSPPGWVSVTFVRTR